MAPITAVTLDGGEAKWDGAEEIIVKLREAEVGLMGGSRSAGWRATRGERADPYR
jgi:hypothetical protein